MLRRERERRENVCLESAFRNLFFPSTIWVSGFRSFGSAAGAIAHRTISLA